MKVIFIYCEKKHICIVIVLTPQKNSIGMPPANAPSPDIYTLLVNSVQEYAILLLDADGRIQNWNKGAELIKGYGADEAIGKNFEIFYPAEDRQSGLPAIFLKEALAKGHIQEEGWRVRKDGSRFWANVTITALYGPERNLLGFSKVTCDLTAQHAVMEDNAKLHQILDRTNEAARIGVWEADYTTDIVTWSKVTKQILELPEDYQPIMADSLSFFKEGDSRDIVRDLLRETVTHGTPFDIDLLLVTATGREIWCRSIAQAEFRDGVCVRAYGTFQDIDVQKRAQIELQLSEEQFRRSFDLSGIRYGPGQPGRHPHPGQ